MPNINLKIGADLLARIDADRGDVPRTRYLNRTLAWALDRLEVRSVEAVRVSYEEATPEDVDAWLAGAVPLSYGKVVETVRAGEPVRVHLGKGPVKPRPKKGTK